MTAALLKRPAVTVCRYPAWCVGDCVDTAYPTPERNHWSRYYTAQSAEFHFERVSAQAYKYEFPDDDLPATVHVSVGDDDTDTDGVSLTPAAARNLGTAMAQFKPRHADYEDELIWEHPDGFLIVEFRHERYRHNGLDQPDCVEVAVRDGVGRPWTRVGLDRRSARAFGRDVLKVADVAEACDHNSTQLAA